MTTCHYDILAKTRMVESRLSRFPAKMTLVHAWAIIQYWENLVLVVVLVSESKAHYFAMPPQVSPRNDVWETTIEIPYQ